MRATSRSSLTNDKRQILQFSGVSLILDCRQAFFDECLGIMSGRLVDDNLPQQISNLDRLCTIILHTKFIDSEIRRQDMPMLTAVSCLSPVRTQTYH